MATKSILKMIDIKEKNLGRSFVNALEHAENKSSKHVEMSRKVVKVKKDQIKALFGE